MATSFAFKPIVTDGLVLCLDAGNTKSYPGSGATWLDLSSNSNTGTLYGVPAYSTANSGILNFNGSSQVATAVWGSSVPIGGAARTMWCWFRWTASGYSPPGHEIFGMGDNNGIGRRIAMWIDQPSASIGIEVQGTGKVIGSWSGRNTWVNLCVTMPLNGDLNSVLIYYNGNLASATLLGGNVGINTPGGEIKIGGIPTVPSGYLFQGDISQVMIYNRVLSAAEVLQNYNATKNRFI